MTKAWLTYQHGQHHDDYGGQFRRWQQTHNGCRGEQGGEREERHAVVNTGMDSMVKWKDKGHPFNEGTCVLR